MFKIVEYICNNENCRAKGSVVERFLDSKEEDIQICLYCSNPVNKILSAVRGYVKNTSNPCKC